MTEGIDPRSITRDQIENQSFPILNYAILLNVLKKGRTITLRKDHPIGVVDKTNTKLINELTRRGFKVIKDDFPGNVTPNVVMPAGTKITVLTDHFPTPDVIYKHAIGGWKLRIHGLEDLFPECYTEIRMDDRSVTTKELCEQCGLDDGVIDQLVEVIRTL